MNALLSYADAFESSIVQFLKSNKDGGRFIFEENEKYELAIPLMILTFENRGWEVQYDCDGNKSWLDFSIPVCDEE